MLTLGAPSVVTGSTVLTPGFLRIEAGRVLAVEQGRPPPGALVLPEGYLAPGLVDLQVNGGFGIDLGGASAGEMASLAAQLPSCGVTSFAPTFISAPLARLQERLVTAREAGVGWEPGRARLLRAHLEGPFLSPARAGAHDPAVLALPRAGDVAALLAAAGGSLGIVTLAPELPGALAAIAQLVSAGVLVSIGHSDATAAQASAGVAAGARMATHLFNASAPLGHREPGVPGALLLDERVALGCIADLHHLHPHICTLLFRAAPERVVLVSDATAALAMPPGRYELNGPVHLAEGGAPPRRPDGTLAGSALRLVDAVRNVVELGVSVAAAVHAAAVLPGRYAGHPGLGMLAPGGPADCVWLGAGLELRATLVAGELAFGALG